MEMNRRSRSVRDFLRSRGACAMALATVVLAPGAVAQCFDWASGFHEPVAGGNGVDKYGYVHSLAVADVGTGPALYAGGYFHTAGSVAALHVARWNGTSWSPLGPGLGVRGSSSGDGVFALLGHDDGSGPALFAGGAFNTAGTVAMTNIARWNGSSWQSLGSGVGSISSGAVRELATFDDGTGPALYAGGSFSIAGGLDAHAIAKWNGVSWSPLGAGLGNSVQGHAGQVFGLAAHDDGSGPALFVGGTFRSAGGASADLVAKWDGTAWHSLGTGLAGTNPYAVVQALAVFDDGSGPSVYAGGWLDVSGVRAAVARWDGTTWTALPFVPTIVENARALTVFDDGNGAALYAAGSWNGIWAYHPGGIGRWNGSSWSIVGETQTLPNTLAVFDDGIAGWPALYVGGGLTNVGGLWSSNIAAWRRCEYVGTPYCFGDGSLATPCPCAPPDTIPGPSGAPDSGCANSFHASGAKLVAQGTTNPDHVRLRGSMQSPTGYTILISGNGTEIDGVAYHDGVRCAGGAFVRFGPQYAYASQIAYPNPALGLTHPLSVVSGVTPGMGQTRYYQALYRDNKPGFCSSGTLNLSNAVSLTW